MIGQILVGIIIIVCGVACVYYSGPISQVIGRSNFADQYLGGTKNAVVLFGFLIIIIGVLFAFGVLKGGSPMDVDSTF